MKKVVYILSTIIALVACAKEAPIVEEPAQEANKEIKVNFNITRSDITNDTKAAVKSGWAVNDVVFIFFKRAHDSGVYPVEYLELKYDGSDWDATWYPDGDFSDILTYADNTLTAIYLPYGSGYTVSRNDGSHVFYIRNASGENYCGHFYMAEKQEYTYDAVKMELTGTIHLEAAAPTSGDGDKLVHFDISGGFVPGNTYLLNQDYIKPLSLSYITIAGTVTTTIGNMGDAVPGFYDADPNNDGNTEDAIMSFSGILDQSVVGSKNDYRFLIHDITDDPTGHVAYSRTDLTGEKGKNIDANMYIGIGAISGEGSKWTRITVPYFSVAPTKVVTFAPANLLYDEGTWKFQEHQWTFCFDGVEEGSDISSYFASDKTFDLFGWGASGWSGGGWTNYQPWNMAADGGPATFGPSDGDLIGAYANGDWGVYIAIDSNGAGYWRLPTGGPQGNAGEWGFLAGGRRLIKDGVDDPDRTNAHMLRSYGTVNSKIGLIILPDNFVDPVTNKGSEGTAFVGGVPRTTGSGGTADERMDYSLNVYSEDDWTEMEKNGAIFLPMAGRRNGSDQLSFLESPYYSGGYWTSIHNGNTAYIMGFGSSRGIAINQAVGRNQGRPVRLIHDLN